MTYENQRFPFFCHDIRGFRFGGRPDLAGEALVKVKSPRLLIVGGQDDVVIELNAKALSKLCCEKEMRIIPGATHLFPEHGKLEEVARISAEWFRDHMEE